jgi:hypothetical protein
VSWVGSGGCGGGQEELVSSGGLWCGVMTLTVEIALKAVDFTCDPRPWVQCQCGSRLVRRAAISFARHGWHYPVTYNSFVLQWGVSVQNSPDLPPAKAANLSPRQ